MGVHPTRRQTLWAWRSYLVFFLAPVLLSPLAFVQESNLKERQCAYVIILMAVYWISECLPVGVTALLPAVLFPFFQIMSTDDVSKEYMNNISMLFVGGLMMAIAIEYWGIHKRVALRVLTLVGAQPRWIMLGMMTSTWFLSMWISNTASTAMMLPITEAILEELQGSREGSAADDYEPYHHARAEGHENSIGEDDHAPERVKKEGKPTKEGFSTVLTTIVGINNTENKPRSHNHQPNHEGDDDDNENKDVDENFQKKTKRSSSLSSSSSSSPTSPSESSRSDHSRGRGHHRKSSSSSCQRRHRRQTGNDVGDTDHVRYTGYYDSMAKGMLLSICYAANCGGIASLTGTGPNLVLKRQVDKLYESSGLQSPITFGAWMSLGLPMSLAMLLVCWVWLQILFFPCRGPYACCRRQSPRELGKKRNDVSEIIREQYEGLGPLVCGQVMVSVLFVVMVILWFTLDMGGVAGWGKEFHPPVKSGTPAILMSILVFALPSTLPFLPSYPLTPHPDTGLAERVKGRGHNAYNNGVGLHIRPLLNWDFAARRFPWSLVLLLGGGFALSSGCQKSGLSPWIGEKLTYFRDWNQYAILFTICFICTATTEFASNSAMTSIMMPILQRLALSTGVHPLQYMIPACFSCSFAYMLPVATPPNAIVFSSGRLKIADMMKAGVVMNILAVPLMIGFFASLGHTVYDVHRLPEEFLNATTTVT